MRSLPLYGRDGLGFFARDGTRGFAQGLSGVTQAHPGLVFDKFIDTWWINTDGGCDIQPPAKKQTDQDKLTYGSKRAWLEETIERYGAVKNVLGNSLTKALERLSKLNEGLLGGQYRIMKSDWRLVSGLGNGHPFETGFIWHRTLGVPYLPGSAVKGLMRAWADPRLDDDGNSLGWGTPTSRTMLNASSGIRTRTVPDR